MQCFRDHLRRHQHFFVLKAPAHDLDTARGPIDGNLVILKRDYQYLLLFIGGEETQPKVAYWSLIINMS